MRLLINCDVPRTLPLPWRGKVFIHRCDSDQVFLRIRRKHRATERYRVSDYGAFELGEDVEVATIEILGGGGGKLDLEFVQLGAPLPVTINPRGGKLVSDTLVISPGEHKRLPEYRVMDGRDVIFVADENNTAPVYVDQFPINPGYVLQIQPALLSDLDIWVDANASGEQRLRYLAEVRV